MFDREPGLRRWAILGAVLLAAVITAGLLAEQSLRSVSERAVTPKREAREAAIRQYRAAMVSPERPTVIGTVTAQTSGGTLQVDLRIDRIEPGTYFPTIHADSSCTGVGDSLRALPRAALVGPTRTLRYRSALREPPDRLADRTLVLTDISSRVIACGEIEPQHLLRGR